VVSGRVMVAKFGMKGHWYPSTLSIFWSSLRFHGLCSQSLIIESLSGVIVMPLGVRWSPKKLISVTLKEHLNSFRKREWQYRVLKKTWVICW